MIINDITFLKGLPIQIYKGGRGSELRLPWICPDLMIQIQGIPDTPWGIIGNELLGCDRMSQEHGFHEADRVPLAPCRIGKKTSSETDRVDGAADHSLRYLKVIAHRDRIVGEIDTAAQKL